MNRRHALKGLGTFIALPMLDCMTPLMADEPVMPKRSAFIYLPNGVNTLDYQITTEGADYQFSRSLKPLEKHRSVITPISGLHHPGGLGHHHNCQKIWLTGENLDPPIVIPSLSIKRWLRLPPTHPFSFSTNC